VIRRRKSVNFVKKKAANIVADQSHREGISYKYCINLMLNQEELGAGSDTAWVMKDQT
jgi:hypothetical protein